MPYKKGQSGNPNGRPPKNRALTEILRARGSASVIDIDGVSRAGNRIVSRALWELATTGQTTLPEREVPLIIGVQGWFEIVKWLYGQIDGPPPRPIELSSDPANPPTIRVVYDREKQ